jgi:hypothetical protein
LSRGDSDRGCVCARNDQHQIDGDYEYQHEKRREHQSENRKNVVIVVGHGCSSPFLATHNPTWKFTQRLEAKILKKFHLKADQLKVSKMFTVVSVAGIVPARAQPPERLTAKGAKDDIVSQRAAAQQQSRRVF